MPAQFRTSQRFELTQRQREVLRLIALGRTNPEIADELGVSLDGAKYHVREIFGKLGVTTREEAIAAWEAGQQPSRWRPIAMLAASSQAVRVALTAGVITVAAAATAALIAWAIDEGNEGGTPADPGLDPSPSATPGSTLSPSPAVSPTASPESEVIAGVDVMRLRPSGPVPLPPGIVLYAYDAAWEGPTAALRRYYREPSGALRTDDLLLSAFVSGDDGASRTIVGVIATPGGGELAVALCHGSCYAELQPVTVVRSSDGGISWEEAGTVERGGWQTAVAIRDEGVVVRGIVPGDPWSFGILPEDADGASVYVPPRVDNAARVLASYAGPTPLLIAMGDDRRALWSLDGAAVPFATIPDVVETGSSWPIDPSSFELVDGPRGPEVYVTWRAEAEKGYIGVIGPAATTFSAVYSWTIDDGLGGLTVTGWIGESLAIGRAAFLAQSVNPDAPGDYFGSVPALIDFATGTVSPIAEFAEMVAAKAGGPVPVAVLAGPAVRVTGAGEGDCLNVREAPGAAGPVIGCFPDGTLLALRGAAEEQEGSSWLPVVTPGGDAGWAAATFLDRTGG